MTTVSFQAAFEALRDRLDEHAWAHCERVALASGELAAAYGVDTALASLAGLLHDWDRELSADELLAAATEAGIALTPADEALPYLLHARTGAHGIAEALPQVPAEVLSAVSRHTLGSPDMSDLEMVVFVADMIEPAREYPGVDELRSVVGSVSLGELFFRAYQQSIAHLVSARRYIHPETVAVWNALVAGGRR